MKGLLVLFILLPHFALAQEPLGNRHSIGFKAGLVRSTLKKHPDNYKMLGVTGITFGFIYKYSFNKKIDFQTEFTFSQKGYRQNSGIYYSSNMNYNKVIYTGPTLALVKFSYLEIPALINYNLVNKRIVVGLQAGVNLNLFIFGSATIEHPAVRETYVETGSSRLISPFAMAGAYVGVNFGIKFKFLVNPRVGLGSGSSLASFKYAELSYVLLMAF